MRDDMRQFLHQLAPHYFHWAQFTSFPLIAKYMLTFPADTMTYTYKCKNNHITPARTPDNTCLISAGNTIYASVLEWMTSMNEESQRSCITCSEKLTLVKTFPFPLLFIALDFAGQLMHVDATFTVSINNAEICYRLCGVIYFGDSHFTSHVINDNHMVWFHDGRVTCEKMTYEGMLDNTFSLNQCGDKEAVAAIYVKC